jgi:hypothetical protein
MPSGTISAIIAPRESRQDRYFPSICPSATGVLVGIGYLCVCETPPHYRTKRAAQA